MSVISFIRPNGNRRVTSIAWCRKGHLLVLICCRRPALLGGSVVPLDDLLALRNWASSSRLRYWTQGSQWLPFQDNCRGLQPIDSSLYMVLMLFYLYIQFVLFSFSLIIIHVYTNTKPWRDLRVLSNTYYVVNADLRVLPNTYYVVNAENNRGRTGGFGEIFRSGSKPLTKICLNRQ